MVYAAYKFHSFTLLMCFLKKIRESDCFNLLMVLSIPELPFWAEELLHQDQVIVQPAVA